MDRLEDAIKVVDEILQNYMEDFMLDGELNLTAIEEQVQNELDISDEEFEEGDFSFEIYQHLVEEGYLND